MIFGGVFERFPKLRVAFAHGGGAFPFTIGRIEHAFHVRPDLVAVVQSRYLPNAVVAWGEPWPSPLWEGRSDGRAYVCRDFACRAPVDNDADLLAQLAVGATP